MLSCALPLHSISIHPSTHQQTHTHMHTHEQTYLEYCPLHCHQFFCCWDVCYEERYWGLSLSTPHLVNAPRISFLSITEYVLDVERKECRLKSKAESEMSSMRTHTQLSLQPQLALNRRGRTFSHVFKR